MRPANRTAEDAQLLHGLRRAAILELWGTVSGGKHQRDTRMIRFSDRREQVRQRTA
jgi:hypothetical protein